MPPKRKIKSWYRRIRQNQEEVLLRRYWEKIGSNKYLTLSPKRQSWRFL